jgi:hypothetical protein
VSEPLIRAIQRSVPTAATTTVSTEKVLPGDRWHIRHLALSDDAAGDISVQFGVTDIIGFRPLFDLQLVSTGDVAWNLCDLILGEEEQLACAVTTTAGAGQVTLHVRGELHRREPVVLVVEGAASAG